MAFHQQLTPRNVKAKVFLKVRQFQQRVLDSLKHIRSDELAALDSVDEWEFKAVALVRARADELRADIANGAAMQTLGFERNAVWADETLQEFERQIALRPQEVRAYQSKCAALVAYPHVKQTLECLEDSWERVKDALSVVRVTPLPRVFHDPLNTVSFNQFSWRSRIVTDAEVHGDVFSVDGASRDSRMLIEFSFFFGFNFEVDDATFRWISSAVRIGFAVDYVVGSSRFNRTDIDAPRSVFLPGAYTASGLHKSPHAPGALVFLLALPQKKVDESTTTLVKAQLCFGCDCVSLCARINNAPDDWKNITCFSPDLFC